MVVEGKLSYSCSIADVTTGTGQLKFPSSTLVGIENILRDEANSGNLNFGGSDGTTTKKGTMLVGCHALAIN